MIRAATLYLQAIAAQYHGAIVEARNKGREIALAVVRIDLGRSRALAPVHVRTTHEGTADAPSIRIDGTAAIVQSIGEAKTEANCILHRRETIDAEVNQWNVVATTIDPEN